MPDHTVIPSTSLFLFIGLLILFRRIRSMHKPTKGRGKRIILPLLLLTPGCVFLSNIGSATVLQLSIAVIIGLGLSIPLILWSGYEIRNDGKIYAKKSPAFIITFALMIFIRYYLRQHISLIPAQTLTMLLFLTTLCYLIPWRIACFIKFRQIWSERKSISA